MPAFREEYHFPNITFPFEVDWTHYYWDYIDSIYLLFNTYGRAFVVAIHGYDRTIEKHRISQLITHGSVNNRYSYLPYSTASSARIWTNFKKRTKPKHSPITILGRIKPTRNVNIYYKYVGGQVGFQRKSGGGQGAWFRICAASNHLAVTTYGNGWIEGNTDILNKWTDVAVVHKGYPAAFSNIDLYVNGEKELSPSINDNYIESCADGSSIYPLTDVQRYPSGGYYKYWMFSAGRILDQHIIKQLHKDPFAPLRFRNIVHPFNGRLISVYYDETITKDYNLNNNIIIHKNIHDYILPKDQISNNIEVTNDISYGFSESIVFTSTISSGNIINVFFEDTFLNSLDVNNDAELLAKTIEDVVISNDFNNNVIVTNNLNETSNLTEILSSYQEAFLELNETITNNYSVTNNLNVDLTVENSFNNIFITSGYSNVFTDFYTDTINLGFSTNNNLNITSNLTETIKNNIIITIALEALANISETINSSSSYNASYELLNELNFNLTKSYNLNTNIDANSFYSDSTNISETSLGTFNTSLLVPVQVNLSSTFKGNKLVNVSYLNTTNLTSSFDKKVTVILEYQDSIIKSVSSDTNLSAVSEAVVSVDLKEFYDTNINATSSIVFGYIKESIQQGFINTNVNLDVDSLITFITYNFYLSENAERIDLLLKDNKVFISLYSKDNNIMLNKVDSDIAIKETEKKLLNKAEKEDLKIIKKENKISINSEDKDLIIK